MRSGFKLILITLPLAAIGAGVMAYFVATNPPPAQKPLAERTRAVRVIVAANHPVLPRVTGFGLVAPGRTYEAIAQVGGAVTYVNPDLEKGAILPEGAVLVRLSQADFKLATAQAQANIRAAQAKMAELAVSAENQALSLAIEKEALALKQTELARVERLSAGGTVSQSTLDSAHAAHLAQRQKVQAIESTLALLPTQRAVQEEQIAVYQASLETAQLNLARTVLSLPFTARVASAPVEVGQYMAPGQKAAVLDGVGRAEVEAQMPVAALRTLLQLAHPDQAIFTSDPTLMTNVLRTLDLGALVRLSLGQESLLWEAQIDRISDTMDPRTGTLGVIVTVDTAYSGARPGERPPLTKGMFVEVSLSAAPVAGIVIPRSALRDGQVMVVNAESRLALVPVTPLLVQDDIAVIAEGLTEDQRVVVSDLSPALPGMLLEPVQDVGLMMRLIAEGQAQ